MTKQASTTTTPTPTSPTTTNPKPNRRIEHVTIIEAPIQDVWKALIKVNEWSWNKWTRLEVQFGINPATGVKGKLKACYEGNDKDWQTFDFEFAAVDPSNHLLAWQGAVAGGYLFKGYHTMKLEKVPSERNQTKLIHREVFSGLLPILKLGLPYAKLDRNYRLMNEALKEHIEK